MIRVEIDGRPADVDGLRAFALGGGYGHFTAMQVRDGRTRGLDLHLARLHAANRELFGRGLDRGQVRDHIRHAVGADGDGSVRVQVIAPEDAVSIMVTVRPPGAMARTPQGLLPVDYQRPAAHLKHNGGFGQEYFRRLAQRAGFDEALLTTPDGVISEGGITNVGCWDGSTLVWPDAPALAGVTMQLLRRALPSRTTTLRVGDLTGYDAVFVSNSRGIALVDRVGDVPLPTPEKALDVLRDAYGAVRWDPL